MIDLDKIPPEWQPHYTRYQSMTAERGCEAIEEIVRLTEKLEEKEANPPVGICSFCRATIWSKQERIDDEFGTSHPLCHVKYRLEAELQRLRTENERLIKQHELEQEVATNREWWITKLRSEDAEKDRIIAALKRPVTDQEMAQFAIHTMKLGPVGGPFLDTFVLWKDAATNLIASRSQEAQKGATE